MRNLLWRAAFALLVACGLMLPETVAIAQNAVTPNPAFTNRPGASTLTGGEWIDFRQQRAGVNQPQIVTAPLNQIIVRGGARPSPYRIVVPRGRISGGAGPLGGGTATGVRRESRKYMPFLSVAPVGRLWFMMPNSYVAGAAGGEQQAPAGVTYAFRMAIASMGTQTIKCPAATTGLDPDRTRGLGATSTGDPTTYAPSGSEPFFFCYADPTDFGITTNQWPANTNMWVCTTETFAQGATVIQTTDLSGAGAAGEASQVYASNGAAPSCDNTSGFTGGLGGGGFNYQPVAVLGLWAPGARLNNVLYIGDSIPDGSSLTKDSGFNVAGALGACSGAGSGSYIDCASRIAGLPYVKATRGSDGYGSRQLGLKWITRRTLELFADQVVDTMGLNSAVIGSDVSLAIVKDMVAEARAAGVQRYIHSTITMTSTSSNSWATVAGQTASSGRPDIVNFNTKLQGIVGRYNGPDAIADLSSAIASPLDPNKFLTDEVNSTPFYGTVDGTHPSQMVQTPMANIIVPLISAPIIGPLSSGYDLPDWTKIDAYMVGVEGEKVAA